MPLTMISSSFVLNGVRYSGSFTEYTEENWVNSGTSEPDVEWSFVDNCGHFHAFDTYSSELPTLFTSTVRVPCDGGCGPDGCGGYPAKRFRCRICDEPVEPKYNPIVKRELVAVDHSWSATVEGAFIAPGTRVSVQIEREGFATRFGVAVVGKVTYESGGMATIELNGMGRLGHRPLAEVTR